MIIQQAIEKISLNPRLLFLIDGAGAIVSAFLLGVVLVEWEGVFGIPPSALYCLAFFPALFAIYDVYNYRKKQGNVSWPLKIIATMNLMYCGLSMGLAIYHQKEITYYGWAYIIFEIIIVMALATLELRVATQTNNNL